MKSQPNYPPLEWDASGRQHLLLAGVEDPALAQRLYAAPPRGSLVVIDLQGSGASAWQRYRCPGARYLAARDGSAALALLRSELEAAEMGTRLYLVGNEDLLWQATRLGAAFGLGDSEVRRYRAGTCDRPVCCTHCGTYLRSVPETLVACTGCSRTLFVRDHFSRRLGAYMGIHADAEVRGDLPAAREFQA